MASCGSKSCLALNEKTKQKSEKKFFLKIPLKRIKKELRKFIENSRRSMKNKKGYFLDDIWRFFGHKTFKSDFLTKFFLDFSHIKDTNYHQFLCF